MRTSRLTFVAVLTAALAFASTSQADPVFFGTYVHGMVAPIFDPNCGNFSTNAGGSPNCLFDGTDPRFFADPAIPYLPTTEAGGAYANHSGAIGGSANLATGDLSIVMDSDGAFHTTITAFMWDTITFHFDDADQHLVSVHMAGEAGTTGGALGNVGYRLDLSPGAEAHLNPKFLMMDGFSFLANGPYSASSSLLVHDGMQVNLLAGLWMFGGGVGTGFAFDPLTFDLDGGTFTSESGVLLTQTSSVPEPTTLALATAGLCAAAVQRRRRPRLASRRRPFGNGEARHHLQQTLTR